MRFRARGMWSAREIAERVLALLVACAVTLAAVVLDATTWHYNGVQPVPIHLLLGLIAFALTLRYRTVWMSAAWTLVPIGFVLSSIVFYLRDDTIGTRTAASVMAGAGLQAVLMIVLGTAAAVFWLRRQDVDRSVKPPAS